MQLAIFQPVRLIRFRAEAGSALLFVDLVVAFAPDDRTFALRSVEKGREVNGLQVVNGGLKPGDKVVTTGAFVLKSELILQNTPEEE